MIKLVDIINRTNNEDDAFQLAIELNLINMSSKICLCGSKMNIEKGKTRHQIDGRWRCNKRGCRKNESLFKNTIFHNTHLKISEILRVLYMNSMEVKVKYIANELNISEDSIYFILNKFYDKIDSTDSKELFGRIGGNDSIVEVDETHICSRRDGRGRILRGERYWIIGAICRSTKLISCELVRNRTSRICSDFVRNNIESNAHIMTDFWRGYNSLVNFGYAHSKINHKLHFVDPDNPNIHTQNIERLWKSFKSKCVNTNSYDYILKSMRRFVFEKNMDLKLPYERFIFLTSINLL
jgi:hypothetical protein